MQIKFSSFIYIGMTRWLLRWISVIALFFCLIVGKIFLISPFVKARLLTFREFVFVEIVVWIILLKKAERGLWLVVLLKPDVLKTTFGLFWWQLWIVSWIQSFWGLFWELEEASGALLLLRSRWNIAVILL